MSFEITQETGILKIRAENADSVSPAQISDKQLVENVLAGDEAAFEQIFERHKLMVGCVVARFFRQTADIGEIVQISFTKVYFELKNFRGERDLSLASLLARTATNACIDVLRSRKSRRESFFSELSDEETSFLIDKLHSENRTEQRIIERDLAEKLLSRLKAEDRALLEMLDAEEMTVAEVCKVTGWSKSNVKIRAYRARKVLKKIIHKFL